MNADPRAWCLPILLLGCLDSAPPGVEGPVPGTPSLDGVLPAERDQGADDADMPRPRTADAAHDDGCRALTELRAGEALVPNGSFTRGLARGVGMPAETPSHRVTVTQPFALGVHEVTVAEWMEADRHAVFTPLDLDCGGPSCPIAKVSWFESVAFANRRSVLHGLSPCYRLDCDDEVAEPGCGGAMRCLGDFHCRVVEPLPDCTGYRLPTEAEWERAAGGPTDEPQRCGQPIEACGPAMSAARRVGLSSGRQGFGLHDVLGNVAEWSADAMLRYPDEVVEVLPDPRTSVVEFDRDAFVRMAFRGGAFGESEAFCRVSMRRGEEARSRAAWIGLRLARNVRCSFDPTASEGQR